MAARLPNTPAVWVNGGSAVTFPAAQIRGLLVRRWSNSIVPVPAGPSSTPDQIEVRPARWSSVYRGGMTNRIRAVLSRLSGRTTKGEVSGGTDRTRRKQAVLQARRQRRECRDYFPGSSGWAGR